MPVFIWEGKLPDGGTKKGEMEAASEEAVRSVLQSQKITPIKIKKKGESIFNKELNISFLQPKVTIDDLVVFTRQFATMIDAGLPIVQGLEILAQQQPNPTFKKVLMEVKADVEGGSTFAEALRKHPKVFDTLFVSLVAAGEVGGVLDTVLNRLATQMEKAKEVREKVKKALRYPTIVIVVAVVVVAAMMKFVIPTFAKMFEDMGGQLPLPTRIAINMSNWFSKNFMWLFLGIIAVVVVYRFIANTDKGRRIIDSMMLRMPAFGDLIKKQAVARFTRTLGTILSSGVPIVDGLEIVAAASGNKIIEEEILKIRDAITEGKNMTEPLKESKIFPPLVVQMIEVGEQTGSLDTMLNKIADFYENEVDAAVEGITAMIEPLIVVFLGVVVGGLLIAMYLPIFKLGQAVMG